MKDFIPSLLFDIYVFVVNFFVIYKTDLGRSYLNNKSDSGFNILLILIFYSFSPNILCLRGFGVLGFWGFHNVSDCHFWQILEDAVIEIKIN